MHFVKTDKLGKVLEQGDCTLNQTFLKLQEMRAGNGLLSCIRRGPGSFKFDIANSEGDSLYVVPEDDHMAFLLCIRATRIAEQDRDLRQSKDQQANHG